MFTGLVETQGEIVERNHSSDHVTLKIRPLQSLGAVKIGSSIAVNGCCLTVTRQEDSLLSFDILEETDRRTNFKSLKAGSRVNLEQSLLPTDRIGGHFVTGHIDTTAKILRWESSGRDRVLEIELATEFQKWIVTKGCIAVDGISLTVSAVFPDRFQLWIIPHTAEVTRLMSLRAGDDVNLEFDLLAKYAEKSLLHLPQ